MQTQKVLKMKMKNVQMNQLAFAIIPSYTDSNRNPTQITLPLRGDVNYKEPCPSVCNIKGILQLILDRYRMGHKRHIDIGKYEELII